VLNFGFLEIDCVLRSVNQVHGLDSVDLKSDLGPESVCLYLSLKMVYSISLYESQVELYSLDPGYRTRTRLCTGNSSSTNTGYRHVSISVKSYPLHMELMSCLTEEQDQLLYILYLGANWSQNGSLSLLVRFILLLTKQNCIN
jgi:hypothetical protein